MSWGTSVIGIDEARLVAIQTRLQAKIGDLDTVLQLAPMSWPAGSATSGLVVIGDPEQIGDKATPFLICVMGGGKADASDLESDFKYIGQPDQTANYTNKWYSQIRFYVSPNYANPGSTATWAALKTYTENTERLVARFCDWFRGDVAQLNAFLDLSLGSIEGLSTTVSTGVASATQALASVAGIDSADTLYFAIAKVSRTILSIAGLNVTLSSSVTTVTNEVVYRQDKLTRGRIVRIQKGIYEKGFGNTYMVRGATVEIEHILN